MAFIRRHEGGLRKVAYDNDGAQGGNCTVGYGHLIHGGPCTTGDHHRYDHHTAAYYRELLEKDLNKAERAVRRLIKVPLNQHRWDALVSFVFNVGVGNFESSTLLRVLNKRHYSQVPAQMMRWVHGNGGVVQGLINRRKAEVKVWREGDYSA